MSARTHSETRNGYPMFVARCDKCRWAIGYSAIYDPAYAKKRAKADCKKHNKEKHA